MLGTYALSAGYYDAYYAQASEGTYPDPPRDFERAFEQVDLISRPLSPLPTAFKIGEHGDDPLAKYLEDVFNLPANLAGVPGHCITGRRFDTSGLPVGMQLMGRAFSRTAAFSSWTMAISRSRPGILADSPLYNSVRPVHTGAIRFVHRREEYVR
jgi:aspartyl-tRNA(Asn)/glutamyl-tRNA(Gln) amidotransferase subunit A